MEKYNLGFITDADIYRHVKETVRQYSLRLDLKQFNKNIVDPIKLTFDAKIYGQTIAEAIQTECIRQIDKTNTNKIGYFHQNIFRYAGNGWEVPENGSKGGFDVVNEERHIFVEVKNKHNTMNRASASDTYIKMQSKLLDDDRAVCYLAEVIARHSQDVTWTTTINKNGTPQPVSHRKIRRISMDRFYALAFGDEHAFVKLCRRLPDILDDVIAHEPELRLEVSVYDELGRADFFRQLYMLAFSEYEGFDQF